MLDSAELQSTFDKYKKIKGDIKYSAGDFDENDHPRNHDLLDFTRELFAFSSIDNVFDKYKEMDSNWGKSPTINNLCIVGKGWWGFCANKWNFVPANSDYEEVIVYLSNLVNTLPKVAESRKTPRIDQYLTDFKTRTQLN